MSSCRFASRLSRTVLLGVLVAVLGVPGSTGFAEEREAQVPSPFTAVPWGLELPGLSFEERRADGTTRELDFSTLRGRPIVIVLWATWCGICEREMPKLNKLAASLGPKGVQVVAMSIDKGGSEIPARYLRKKKLNELRVFHDYQQALYPALGVWGVPTALIADSEGRIIARTSGPVPWDSAPVRRFLLEQVDSAPNPRT